MRISKISFLNLYIASNWQASIKKTLMIVHILSAEKGMRIFWGISSYKYSSQLFNKVSIQGKNADGMKGAREYGELKVLLLMAGP